MEYYSATKRNELLIHTTTQMGLENIILTKTSHIQRNMYCVIALM